MLDVVFFVAFAFLTLAGALATVTLRNPVHCAAGLTCSLMGVAGIFLLQGAEFLSVAQIIVYVGGIVLLFLFVIMLVNVGEAERERRFSKNAKFAVLISAGVRRIDSVSADCAKPLALAVPVLSRVPSG